MRQHEQTPFTRLLEDYCRSVGMGDFEVEPEGGVFEIDEDVTITVTHDADFGRLAMVAAIGSATPEEIERLAPMLLHLNGALGASGGFAFAADIDDGALLLRRSAPLEAMKSESFDAELAGMAAKCRSARELIATLEKGPGIARELMEKAEQADRPIVTIRI